MKTKSLFASLLLMGALSFTAVSCDDDDAGNDDAMEETSATEGAAVEDGTATAIGNDPTMGGQEVEQVSGYTNQMDMVWKEYADLRNELYDADAEGAKKEAMELSKALEVKDKSAAGAESWNLWANDLQRHLTPVAESSDVDAIRNEFDNISAEMRKGVMMFGLSEDVHWQYCPMARNDQGAYWLSAEKEIRNPYFGDKMKTCGETKGTLQKRES